MYYGWFRLAFDQMLATKQASIFLFCLLETPTSEDVDI
jgi:hypothetical protein